MILLQIVAKSNCHHPDSFGLSKISFDEWAKMIDVCVDCPRTVSNREEGSITIKETVPFKVCLFEKEDLSNFLAVFGSSYKVPV
ncbi:MAG: hypothetical protein QW186_09185 [Candidatus Bathyarchaeia archaeon]